MDRQEIRIEEREKLERFFVENLLRSTDFSIEKIAALTGVTLDFVNEIKSRLSL